MEENRIDTIQMLWKMVGDWEDIAAKLHADYSKAIEKMAMLQADNLKLILEIEELKKHV